MSLASILATRERGRDRQTARIFVNDTEQTVADRFREYSDTFGRAFHAADPKLLRPYCHVPSMRIGASGASVMQTPEESDARWAEVLGGLPADYDHSVAIQTDEGWQITTWVGHDPGQTPQTLRL